MARIEFLLLLRDKRFLLFCVGLWAVLCLVVPRALTTFAEGHFPNPESNMLQEKIDTERKDRRAGRELRAHVLRDTLRRYGVKRAGDLPIAEEMTAGTLEL